MSERQSRSQIRTAEMAVLFTLLLIPSIAVRAADGDEKKKPQAEKPQKSLEIVVSKKTTRFTAPLDKDGRVNFAEAINLAYEGDITAETNFAVPLYQALGPQPDNRRLSKEFFDRIGMEVPPDDGNYLVPVGAWIRKQYPKLLLGSVQARSMDVYRSMSRGPWKRDQNPDAWAWLEAMNKPLALISDGVRRPGYFSPLLRPRRENGKPRPLTEVLLPGVQMSREFARAFAARSLLHQGEGREADAWQDLLSCHRLGRHIGHGPTLIERLVGIGIENIAIQQELKLIERMRPGGKRIRLMRRQLADLPTFNPMADSVDVTERVLFLDVTSQVSRGMMSADELAGLGGGGPIQLLLKVATNAADWNDILEMGNGWYDRIVEAMQLNDDEKRHAALEKIEQELKDLRETISAPTAFAALLLPGVGRQAISRHMGNTLITMVIPAVHAAGRAENRAIQNFRNLQLAMALAEYRGDTGKYPDTLQALTGKYINEIPKDVFSEKGLNYKPTKNGYLLYSYGPNRKDDGGATHGEAPEADDQRVRMRHGPAVPNNQE